MAIDVERAFVLALVHEVGNLAHGPDDAEHMVGMAMRDEHVMALLVVESRELKLAQNRIAAARIRQEQAAVTVIDDEAGVVAFRDHGTSRAEHREFPHGSPSAYFFVSFLSATSAARCSASFLLGPSPLPQTFPLIFTAKT